MAQIQVSNLTFGYEGSFDNIFENASFSIDTNWKLGFIGRNGKGKTTFLRLLLGDYEYQGSIRSSTAFDYFPYQVQAWDMQENAVDLLKKWKADSELWRVCCEMEELHLAAELLYRPFGTLSHGERTKLMLAVLFSGENDFLLIDEPTNHLDQDSRESIKEYLSRKKGFILVSHDRDLLDECIDHVLVLNRCSIEVQSGNFSIWWENKSRKDAFSKMENEKHKREIEELRRASKRSRAWADKNEKTKIGFHPIKEHDRSISTRAYIGAKTKKMQSRVRQFERRMEREIEEKEGLLKDIEAPVDLKLTPIRHHKEVLISGRKYGIMYPQAQNAVFENLNFTLRQGERIFLHGRNGCGKSSLIRGILRHAMSEDVQCFETAKARALFLAQSCQNSPYFPVCEQKEWGVQEIGELRTAPGLMISYVNQDTSFLQGTIKNFCAQRNLDESLFCAILCQLDMERGQFVKNMEEYSEGQKKKVLIAASLLTPAHLYIWDEPLNYIDVFSRMQIEKLILEYQPTMLVVEHDVRFREKIATQVLQLDTQNDSAAENTTAIF